MKAHIYKPEKQSTIYICVESEGVMESLAIEAIGERQRKGYEDVVISVSGLGTFYPSSPEVKE